MKNISVYTLEGCRFCEEVVEKLRREGVSFSKYEANDPNVADNCNKMDALFENNNYPKIIVNNGTITSFIVSHESKILPKVDNVNFFYYITPEDICSIIKTKL